MNVCKDMLVACCLDYGELNTLGIVRDLVKPSQFKGETIFCVELIFPPAYEGKLYDIAEGHILPILPEVPMEGIQSALPDALLVMARRNYTLTQEVDDLTKETISHEADNWPDY